MQTWGVYYAARPRGDLYVYVMCVKNVAGLGGAVGGAVRVVGRPHPRSTPPPSTATVGATSTAARPLANTNASVDARYPLLIGALLLVGGTAVLGLAGPARSRRCR